MLASRGDGYGSCFIGVDGGATSTTAAAVDEQGHVLAEARVPLGLNVYTVGFERTIERVRQVFCLVRDKLVADGKLPADGKVHACCVAIAGADDAEMRERLHTAVNRELSKWCLGSEVTCDSLAPFGFLNADEPGAVVIAGTGSVARFRSPGEVLVDRRCGGWGHLVSDLGSAYFIATQALTDTVLALEGIPREPSDNPELLWDSYTSRFHADKRARPDGIVKLYGPPEASKSEVAAFAQDVARAAESSDAIALRAFRHAGFELGSLLRGALPADHLSGGDLDHPTTTVLIGGVFKSWHLLQHQFLHALKGVPLRIYIPTHPVAVAAAVIAARTKHATLSLPFPRQTAS